MTATLTRTVRERPILMHARSVRDILDGRKTQTRRPITSQPIGKPGGKYEPHDPFVHADGLTWGWMCGAVSYTHNDVRCPYGQPGDRLWVRETWTADFGETFSDNVNAWWHEMPKSLRTEKAVEFLYYAADDSVYHVRDREMDEQFGSDVRRWGWEPSADDLADLRWQPSIFMPRWACRLVLEITGIRVERVQDISYDDILAEGAPEPSAWPGPGGRTIAQDRDWYRTIWNEINAARGFGWDANPWVWVIEFRKLGGAS